MHGSSLLLRTLSHGSREQIEWRGAADASTSTVAFTPRLFVRGALFSGRHVPTSLQSHCIGTLRLPAPSSASRPDG